MTPKVRFTLKNRRRLLAALDASQQRLEAMVAERDDKIASLSGFIEQLGNPVITTDSGLIITGWNRGAERVFGHCADLALGQRLDIIFNPNADKPDFRALALQPGDSTNREFSLQLRHASGKTVFAHLSLTLMRGGDGAVDSMILNIVDTSTEQAALGRAQESETRYRTLFELSPDAIVELQGDQIFDCNHSALEIFGYDSKEAFIDAGLVDRSPPLQPGGEESRTLALQYFQTCARAGHVSFEWVFRRASGEDFPAEVRIARGDFDGIRRFQAHIRDISQRKRNEETIRSHDYMLEQILDHLPVAVFVKDVNNEFRYILNNRKSVEMFEAQDKTVLGQTDFDASEFSEASTVRQQDLEIARTGQPFHNPEQLLQKPSGESLYLDTQKILITDSAGMPSLILGVSEDISERKDTEKALKTSEKRFRALAANVPVGIFLTDPRGACIYVNEYWQKMTGLNGQQAAGNGWIKALHADDVEAVTTDWWLFTEGRKEFALEYRFVCPQGHVTWVAGKAVAFRNEDDQIVGFLGSITDITQSKQFEHDLRLSSEEAQRANVAKSEFLSRMSHELRTPMNAVLGFGQLLQMNSENLTADQLEGVEHILAGGQHLLNLIEDVLDYARIDTGRVSINLRRTSTASVLRDSVAMVAARAENDNIEIILPDGPVADVLADPRRLQQVLVNLLSNGIKYNRSGGSVEVAVATRPDSTVRISVKDTGTGIQPAERSRLFEPFERVINPNVSIEGTGIGLSICRRMMALMGGQIDFASTYGEGATFWIDLPAAELMDGIATFPDDAGYAVRTADFAGLRLLYVEDDMASIRLLTKIAQSIPGCEFFATSSALDGVALARSSRPDLVLMDINLPGLNGFDALRMLRDDKQTAHIPVVALSAGALPDLIRKGTEAGFACFLTKPLRIESLFQAIATVRGK